MKFPKKLKKKNKVYIFSPYSTEFDNIFVVGPIAGKTHQENFPCSSTRSRKNSDIKYLTYPIYAGGNRGRGQVYPTGDKSNMNVFGATQAGQITEITTAEKESNIVIVDSKGNKVSQVIPAGLSLMVKQGDTVKLIKH
jgi:apocytochrome f